MKILTFEVFYYSVFQKPDNRYCYHDVDAFVYSKRWFTVVDICFSHVLLEFDFAVQQIRRYKKDKPLPVLSFGDIAQHSISQEVVSIKSNYRYEALVETNDSFHRATRIHSTCS